MAQRKMLPGLDGIRLAAIVWIVIYHFGVETATAGLYAPRFFTSPACAALVQGAVFWMTALSGVCLGLKYAGRPLRPGEYVKSRFLAIYPLFWLFFLPLFFYSDILHGNNVLAPGHEHDDLCGQDKFHLVHPDTDWQAGLRHAEKIGIGTMQYELIKM